MDNPLCQIFVSSDTLKYLSNSLPLYLFASDSSRHSLKIIRPGGLNAHCEISLYLKRTQGIFYLCVQIFILFLAV